MKLEASIKKSIFISIGLSAVIILLLLALIKGEYDPNSRKNGFIRRMKNDLILPLGQTTFTQHYFNIAGITKSNFVLTGDNPQQLYFLNHELTKGKTIRVGIPANANIRTGFDLYVDSPNITMYAKNLGIKIASKIDDTSGTLTYLGVPLYSRIAPVSDQIIFLRGFDIMRQIQSFQKIDLASKKIIKKIKLFEDQADAGFSTDGSLLYDNINGRLIFVQYYQNKFYCLDTNLNIVYTGKTIDTISTNKIQTQRRPSGKTGASLMPSAPVSHVNVRDCVYKGYLFNVSSLHADNEKQEEFENNSVIDIYEIQTGKYINSFYIPDYNGSKIQQFRIFDNKIVVLYRGGIATYSFRSN